LIRTGSKGIKYNSYLFSIGECLPIEIGIKKFDVGKENSGANGRWMYRMLSDSALSGVPTVVIPGVVAATGNSPLPTQTAANTESTKPLPVDTGNSDAEMLMLIQKDKERNQTTSTTSTTVETTLPPKKTTTSTTSTTTTVTTKRPIPDFDLETPWDVLKPPQSPNQSSSGSPSTSTTTTPRPLPLPFDNNPKPHPILNIKFPNRIHSTSSSATTLPMSGSTKAPTKPPKPSVFDLETPWDELKIHSMPSTESPPPTTVTVAPTSLSPISATTSHSKPLTTQEVVILKYNHRNQSVASYQPNAQSSTPDLDPPTSSTPAYLPVVSDYYETPAILPSPETYLSETAVVDGGDFNSVTIENPDLANFPVDEVFDDALSYITTLLDKPLLQKSLPKKPIRQQIHPPNRLVFKDFNEFPSFF
jgi:hypothetical protein